MPSPAATPWTIRGGGESSDNSSGLLDYTAGDDAVFKQSATGQLSPIDGQPILKMTERDFYEKRYTKAVHNALAANGPAVLEALRANPEGAFAEELNALSDADGPSSFESGAPVLLGDVFTSVAEKAALRKDGSASARAFPSTHLEIVSEDGSTSEVFLTLSLLNTASQERASGDVPSLSNRNCDNIVIPTPECPDGGIHFVSMDDPDDLLDAPDTGYIWVRATDINNPSWSVNLKVGATGVFDVPGNVQVVALGVESSDDRIEGHSDLPFLAAGTGPTEQRYLALSKLRLESNAESGGSEIVMSVQATDNFSTNYPKRWGFFFDNRVVGHVTVKNVVGLFGDIVEGERVADAIERAFPNGIRTRTRRQQAADGGAYEVPDVDRERQLYSFTNMKSWGLKGKSDGAAANYFPLLPLGTTDHRLLLLEKDKTFPWGNYKYFSRRRNSSPWAGPVQTYNAQTGTYSAVTTRHEGNRHTYGSSDDVILESGARRLTLANVKARMNNNLNSYFVAQSTVTKDHLYEFRTVKNRLVVVQ